jgi:hypothetical protein
MRSFMKFGAKKWAELVIRTGKKRNTPGKSRLIVENNN